MTLVRLRHGLLAASVGGVLGALARYGLTEWQPVGHGFPWTVFAINVLGSASLAAVPALPAVRKAPWIGVFLGTGVLGGFTTMSAASVESVVLADHGSPATAIWYLAGTLAAAVAAAAAISSRVDPERRATAERDEVDE